MYNLLVTVTVVDLNNTFSYYLTDQIVYNNYIKLYSPTADPVYDDNFSLTNHF